MYNIVEGFSCAPSNLIIKRYVFRAYNLRLATHLHNAFMRAHQQTAPIHPSKHCMVLKLRSIHDLLVYITNDNNKSGKMRTSKRQMSAQKASPPVLLYGRTFLI